MKYMPSMEDRKSCHAQYCTSDRPSSFACPSSISPSSCSSLFFQYALKVTDLGRLDIKRRQCSLQEVGVLNMLNHPNILKYFTSVVVGPALCLVTEYCSNGDLKQLLDIQIKMTGGDRFLPEQTIVEWFRQLASALEYLHAIPILHRDIKTSNIFLTDDFQTKLGDFGLAKLLESPASRATTFCGSWWYMSPEILTGKPYDHKSDIWALGVVMYEIITLTKPFDALLTHQITHQILNDNLPVLVNSYSVQLCSLMSTLLNKDHDQRPATKDILRNAIFKQRSLKNIEIQQTCCSKLKLEQLTNKREESSGQLDMAKILDVIANSNDFDNKEYSIDDIIKHIIDITKDVSLDYNKCATSDIERLKQYRQSPNHKSNQNKIPFDMTTIEEDNILDQAISDECVVVDRVSVALETSCNTNSKSHLDRFRRRVKAYFSRLFRSRVSTSHIQCDGCGQMMPSNVIILLEEKRFCRACFDTSGCEVENNSKTENCSKGEDQLLISNNENVLVDTLQPINDIDLDKCMPKIKENEAVQPAVDGHFERMVLAEIEQTRCSKTLGTSGPVDNGAITVYQDTDGKQKRISEDANKRLCFVYEAVESHSSIFKNNQTHRSTDNPLIKPSGPPKVLYKMPKPKKRAPDIIKQSENMRLNRLAFLDKMRQGR